MNTTETGKRTMSRILSVLMAIMVCTAFTLATPDEVSAASKKPSKVTISSAKSADYNAVKVVWKKTKNAKQYQVYRATSKKGKYKKVATTKSLSYTNKSLTTGKTYYYKVRAVNGKKAGSFSAVKSAKPALKKTTVSVKANSATINSVSWKKVNGATGYVLYRSTKGGSYKKIATTKSLSYKDKSVKAKTKYAYKVRAYRTVSGKAVYGSYSSAKAVTTPKATATAAKPSCSHNWTEVWKVRTVKKQTTEIVTDKTGECSGCDFKTDNLQLLGDHIILEDFDEETGKCTAGAVHKGEPREETIWEYVDEEYLAGYKCSKCGATK